MGLNVGSAHLLRKVDFEMLPGEVVVIVGPNGAGKSSLLRVLASELPPTEGQVLMDGRFIQQIPRIERARRLAVLPQHSTLDFPFSVYEVIEMGRIPHASGRSANMTIVSQVMERLKLTPLKERIYTTLSGGERQRVQIARVLCQLWDKMPGGYLMFDEPTAPLDLSYQLAFLDIARELAAQNAGVLLVMHDINLAIRCADCVVIMRAGGIIAAGRPADVVTVENIRAAFDVDVTIVATESGAPLVYARSAL